MKRYIVKPDHLAKWQAYPMTVITEADVENFSREWEIPVDDLLDQLIELKETGWTAIHRFVGQPDWQELNDLIREDSGVEEDYCESEEDYQKAVKDGWITYDGYYTTIWADEMG